MKNNKKIKQMKQVNRQAQLDDIRKFGASSQLPYAKIFKDKRKDLERRKTRGPFRGDE